MKPATLGIAQLLRLAAGLIVWSSAFVWLYAGFSLGCQRLEVPIEAGRVNPVTLGLVAIALVHAAALVFLLVRYRRDPVQPLPAESERSCRLRHRVEGLVLWASLAGLVFVAFPILMVPPCAG